MEQCSPPSCAAASQKSGRKCGCGYVGPSEVSPSDDEMGLRMKPLLCSFGIYFSAQYNCELVGGKLGLVVGEHVAITSTSAIEIELIALVGVPATQPLASLPFYPLAFTTRCNGLRQYRTSPFTVFHRCLETKQIQCSLLE